MHSSPLPTHSIHRVRTECMEKRKRERDLTETERSIARCTHDRQCNGITLCSHNDIRSQQKNTQHGTRDAITSQGSLQQWISLREAKRISLKRTERQDTHAASLVQSNTPHVCHCASLSSSCTCDIHTCSPSFFSPALSPLSSLRSLM